MEKKVQADLAPMLYLCATPIGNMEDITLRTVRVLEGVSCIYCEDTRHTLVLLNRLGIRNTLIPCHAHNENQCAAEIARRVQAGEAVAFVSDAGMPGISDPGERLASACIRENVPFTVLPGPSASLTALVLSGLPSRGACFYGFLPREGKARREAVTSLASHRGTLVFYESPLRVAATCAGLAAALGNRPAALVRELTKLHEEAVREPLLSLASRYDASPPRGECVLLVGGAPEPAAPAEADVQAMLKALLGRGVRAKDAAKEVAALLDVPRNEAYRMAVEIREAGE